MPEITSVLWGMGVPSVPLRLPIRKQKWRKNKWIMKRKTQANVLSMPLG